MNLSLTPVSSEEIDLLCACDLGFVYHSREERQGLGIHMKCDLLASHYHIYDWCLKLITYIISVPNVGRYCLLHIDYDWCPLLSTCGFQCMNRSLRSLLEDLSDFFLPSWQICQPPRQWQVALGMMLRRLRCPHLSMAFHHDPVYLSASWF